MVTLSALVHTREVRVQPIQVTKIAGVDDVAALSS